MERVRTGTRGTVSPLTLASQPMSELSFFNETFIKKKKEKLLSAAGIVLR